jgi:hypothetical protein
MSKECWILAFHRHHILVVQISGPLIGSFTWCSIIHSTPTPLRSSGLTKAGREFHHKKLLVTMFAR